MDTSVVCPGCMYADRWGHYCGLGNERGGCTQYEQGAAPMPVSNEGNGSPTPNLIRLGGWPFPMSSYLLPQGRDVVAVLNTSSPLVVGLCMVLGRTYWAEPAGWTIHWGRLLSTGQVSIEVMPTPFKDTMGWLDLTLPFDMRLQLYSLLCTTIERIDEYYGLGRGTSRSDRHEASDLMLRTSSFVHDSRYSGFGVGHMYALWVSMDPVTKGYEDRLLARYSYLLDGWSRMREVQVYVV